MSPAAPSPSPSPEYAPGDKVRITSNEPYGTELMKGDIVTVRLAATKIEDDGTNVPIVIVYTAEGDRMLGIDVIERLRLLPYTPGEPDDVVDGILTKMVEADDDLTALLRDADTALGAVDDAVGGALTEDDNAHTPSDVGGTAEMITVTDFAGDTMGVVFYAHPCAEHGTDDVFIFEIDGAQVVIPARSMPPLMQWFGSHLSRGQGGPTA